MKLLTDEDVMRLLSPTEAVSVMENVFLARARGTASGVPRLNVPFQNNRMTFTIGGVEDVIGFRVYLRGKFEHDDQLVVVWDQTTGALRGLVVGELVGVMRTGAIGGVAVKHLARFDATSVAIIGTGRQAFAQLRSIVVARIAIREVRVYSRTPEHRSAFCEDVRALMPRLNIFPVDSAEAAIREADIVIGATTSRESIIKGEWLKVGAHVSTLGPKEIGAAEIDLEVVERADFIATDSPEQAADSPNGSIASDKTIYDLAAVVSRQVGRPSDEAITLFLSAGLAGTEVALAAHLLEKVDK